jgi:hypothetical protein
MPAGALGSSFKDQKTIRQRDIDGQRHDIDVVPFHPEPITGDLNRHVRDPGKNVR